MVGIPLSLPVLFLPLALALNITYYTSNRSLVPVPQPKPGAAANCDAIVASFMNLGRSTQWNLISAIKVQGDTYEPEGMVRIGDDRYVVSAGEYTNATSSYGTVNGTTITVDGTDRTAGAGFAHLIVFDGQGTRIADATLTGRASIEYHNGGIDYDGQYIWATIAQYRPNSTAHIVRVDPQTLEPTNITSVIDHQGGIVHDTQTNKLYTLDWGSRNASTWCNTSDAATFSLVGVTRNPSYFVDYQDCKFLGHPKTFEYRGIMLCSGVTAFGSGAMAYNLGGIALVDLETMTPVAEVPITLMSELGVRITENPVDVDVVNGQLRLYWLPDQHNSTLYIYEADTRANFEYGGSGGGGQSYQFP